MVGHKVLHVGEEGEGLSGGIVTFQTYYTNIHLGVSTHFVHTKPCG